MFGAGKVKTREVGLEKYYLRMETVWAGGEKLVGGGAGKEE